MSNTFVLHFFPDKHAEVEQLFYALASGGGQQFDPLYDRDDLNGALSEVVVSSVTDGYVLVHNALCLGILDRYEVTL